MLWDIGRWVVIGILLVLFLSVALFEVLNLPPNDPLFQMLGNPRWLHDLRALRQQIDPREPYWKQYLLWVHRFVGYLWRSIRRVVVVSTSAVVMPAWAHRSGAGPAPWGDRR